MSRIRGRDTTPERLVRSVLHSMGYRFRLHPRNLPGRPDIVLSKHRTVVFVHGCFWHRHRRCRYAYTPKTRIAFWTRKFQENVDRDRRTRARLRRLGWQVIVIWECQTHNAPTLRNCLGVVLGEQLPRPQGRRPRAFLNLSNSRGSIPSRRRSSRAWRSNVLSNCMITSPRRRALPAALPPAPRRSAPSPLQ